MIDNERTNEIDVVILSVAMLETSIVTGVNIAADTVYVGLLQRIVLTTFVKWFALIATRQRAVAQASESTHIA